MILSVGTELTEGVIADTHLRFLGSELKSLGFRVLRAVQIPDDLTLFRQALAQALEESGLLLITGGLGPTSDDLTREAVAASAGVELEFQSAVWELLVERYAALGHRLPETNRKQAFIPRGFSLLPNDHGTAPGFWGRIGSPLVAALPGPPAELEPMFRERLLPVLAKQFPQLSVSASLQEELVATALLTPESALEEALQKHRHGQVGWGTRVAEDRIVFSLRGGSRREREQFFQALAADLGPICIRRQDLRPSERLFRILAEKGWTVALAESCTGGLVAKMITDLPGSSQVFWGALVAYSNQAKQRLLGVQEEELERHGAVSLEAASAMSLGLLQRTPAEVALAVTGIAGPAGGSPEKPAGTVCISARLRQRDELLRRFLFSGARDLVRRRSAVAALMLGECLITGADFPAVFPWRGGKQ